MMKKGKSMDSKVKTCVYILGGTILFFAIIIIYNIYKFKTDISIYPESEMINEVKNRYIYIRACHKCDTWFNASITWLIVDYLGAILPFELSAIILYLETFLENNDTKQKAIIAFSILSMVLIIMNFAIRPHEHMQSNRKAFINMDYAINMYVVDKTHNSEILINAMNSGENLVNRGYDVN